MTSARKVEPPLRRRTPGQLGVPATVAVIFVGVKRGLTPGREEEHALTPEAAEQVIALTERDDAREQDALAKERRDVNRRIHRPVKVIKNSGDAASLVAKVREPPSRCAD